MPAADVEAVRLKSLEPMRSQMTDCRWWASRAAFHGRHVAAALAVFLATPARAEVALPDPAMTPGAVDPSVTLDQICNGTTRTRRRPVTVLCNQALAAYNIAPEHRYEYECDHLIPLDMSGANVLSNLWPQRNIEAAFKDRLEVRLKALVCSGRLPLADAQAEITEDWASSYRRRFGTSPSIDNLAPAR